MLPNDMQKIKFSFTAPHNKNAIVIGETRLCIQCIEQLINNQWKIIRVVSDDEAVIRWAKNHSISTLPPAQLDTVQEKNFCLFSIINPYIIPPSFLTKKEVSLALNYHDSFLPKYAGINSTTWAILNDEKIHGITLHKIGKGIDDGDIAAQSTVVIEKNETATSLNLKCSEHLLSLFPETIRQIEDGTLSFSKPDLTNRTYYGSKTIPPNYGVVNGVKDPAVLHRLTRGLTFGDRYENPIACVKVFCQDRFYIVEDFSLANANNIEAPLNDTTLFHTVRDIYGNQVNTKITWQDISIPHRLTNDDLQYLSNVKAQERKYKRQIAELVNNEDASIKILDYVETEAKFDSSSENKNHTKIIILPGHISTSTASALVYFILARFFHNNFIVSLYKSDENIPLNLRYLVENRNFVRITKDTLSCDLTYLENFLAQLKDNICCLIKDFGYRYHLQLLTDIAIVIGEVSLVDKHKMIIRLKKDKIEIEGKLSYKLQIDSIAEVLNTMLHKTAKNELLGKTLKTIDILSDTQYQQIVYEWNKTDKDYPRDRTIHQLFEEQVRKTPDNIAVIYEDTKLTYQELNSKANQLANYLCHNYNIKPDDLIALCIDRNEYAPLTMLAILKASGAYVPIDPSYPDERIGYILSNTKTKVILISAVYKNKLQRIIKQKATDTNIVVIDNKKINNALAKQRNTNPITPAISTNLAYVIYTSGTAGNPKGVMIEHHSVINYVLYMIRYNDLNEKSVGSQYASLSFDAAVIEIYPILLAGGTLYIISEQNKLDLTKINNFFNENKITYAFFPTKFAESFFELKNNSLINLIVGGEKLKKFANKPYRIVNAYGPTEATVQSTSFIVNANNKHIDIPIGKPIYNTKCYVVDGNLSVLPIGVVGELCVGGVGLARGYLNNINLTIEKFVSNPFQTKEEKSQNRNSRLYKTGDLVRWLPDGNLEYIGRNDLQVKIRGYRIELGEIESKVLNYPGVKQAVVVVKERQSKQPYDKYILVYYVSDKKLDESKIQSYLTTHLPEYMLPQILIHISELPLTQSGKTDTKALPEPKIVNQLKCAPPKNDLEKQICKMFAQVLNLPIEQVGIRDDFFRMGGNSISAIQMVYRIRQKLALNVGVTDIFTHRNIEQLVQNVLTNQNIQENIINIKQEEYPIGKSDLLPIQEWFFNNVRNASYKKHHHWNQSFVIKTPELDRETLKLSIEKLLQHHDAFRLRYKNFEQSYTEVNLAKELENIKHINISDLSDTEIKNKLIEIQSNFNIETGPIYIIAYLYGYEDKSARLFFAMHHLIIDSVSWRILTHDIARLYELLTDPKNTNKTCQELLGPKGTSYRQWAEEIKNYKPIQEKGYWDNILKDYIHIPKSINKDSYDEFVLAPKQTQKLLTTLNEAYDTQVNDILLSALSKTLAEIFGRQVNHITLEGHGREEICPKIDITKTMGWFTIMYPVKLINQPTIPDLIRSTKETLKNIPNKGIGYGPTKEYKNLPNISFNYLGKIGSTKDFWTITDHIISVDPQNQNDNILDIYGYVVNGALTFHVSCNTGLPFNAKIFIDKFKSTLEELIDHCSSRDMINHEITEKSYENTNKDRKIPTLLDQVKLSYARKSNKNKTNKQQQNKIDLYLNNANILEQDLFLTKPITNILLTGSTGFLGCNLLNQLLKLTDYKVFLLIRADSQMAAINRINKKFQFYFDKTLDDVFEKRVFVLKSDLSDKSLGLSNIEYKNLSLKIDSVIHAAALVKHYGDYDNFYLQNVQSTINLLEFTKLTKLKDFHYISTSSLLNGSMCTEDDLPSDTEQDNVYLKTKSQGEHQTIKYRDCGIKSNIYRVGTLAFMAENLRMQENIEESGFLNWVHCLFKLQCVAKEISSVEIISPVDLTARAIVKLFDKNSLSNKTYHVFNPYSFNIAEFENSQYKLEILDVDKFIDKITDEMNRGANDNLIMKFLLYQGWMDSSYIKNINSIRVLQDRTQNILRHLGFEWSQAGIKPFFNKYYKLLNVNME